MKQVLLGAIALLVAAATLPVASAHDCDPNATPTPIGGDLGYVVSDGGAAHGYVVSSWIYLESNGIVGLQRGGNALSNGEPDPCPDVGPPDTLLSGVAIDQGQLPTPAPYPGFVAMYVVGGVPTLLNPLGFACGPLLATTTGGSVTCNPPAPVPPGFAAGCQAQTVGAAFSTLVPNTGSITGALTCGGASVQCASTPAVAGGTMCTAASTATGSLPATCKAQLQPAIYVTWAAFCMWS